MKSFLLFIRQSVGDSMGFALASVNEENLDTIGVACLADHYANLLFLLYFFENKHEIPEQMIEALDQTLAKATGDKDAEIRKSIKKLEEIIPSQCGEVKKMFNSITEEPNRVCSMFVINREELGKSKPQTFPLPGLNDSSFAVRSNLMLTVVEREKELFLEKFPNSSTSEKITEITEAAKEVVINGARKEISEKFLAWASLQLKKESKD
jgi:hypothetical protein